MAFRALETAPPWETGSQPKLYCVSIQEGKCLLGLVFRKGKCLLMSVFRKANVSWCKYSRRQMSPDVSIQEGKCLLMSVFRKANVSWCQYSGRQMYPGFSNLSALNRQTKSVYERKKKKRNPLSAAIAHISFSKQKISHVKKNTGLEHGWQHINQHTYLTISSL